MDFTRSSPCLAAIGVACASLLAGCIGAVESPAPRPLPVASVVEKAWTPPPEVSVAEIRKDAMDLATRGDLAGAARSLGRIVNPERAAVEREVLAGLARIDARRAAALALALPAGPERTSALEWVAPVLIDAGSEAAADWLLTLPDPASRFESGRALADVLVARSGGEAVAAVLRRPAGRERDDWLRLMAARWARRDLTAALAWARRLSPEPLRNGVVASIGFEVAQTNPERAIEVAEALPDSPQRRLVLLAIADTWMVRDANAAQAWVKGLPPGMREAAQGGVESALGGARLGASNPGASALLAGNIGPALANRDPATLPYGPERDAALRRKFDELVLLSPQRAANWYDTLPLPDRRPEMVEQLARDWLLTNPAAGEAWLDQNNVPPAQREQLLRDAGLLPPVFPPP